MIDPLTILALFGPAIKDGSMALIKKWTGDSAGKPANATETIQLMEAETKQLEARINAGDAEGETYKWVIAAIKLQRPIIVYLTIVCYLSMAMLGIGSEAALTMVGNLASTVVFWLFGERYSLKAPQK